MTTKRSKQKPTKITDDRFNEVFTEPRFDALPKKEKKVVIDKRFGDVLSSRKFQGRCEVDMRGRKIDIVDNNNFKDLYELDDDKDSESDDESGKIVLDLARGLGNIASSDEETSDDDLEDDTPVCEHYWGEIDKDAQRIEWASKRLAICNMEWDQIVSADLYMLISSFKPPFPAEILSVKIYTSDFGKKRIEEEERQGPTLPCLEKPVEDNNEVDEVTQEGIRLYQLERLRYYYAIVDCDSIETASAIYESCDGFEFENSALRLDLRFVPDDMVFDESRIRDEATAESIKSYKHKPKQLENNAFSMTKAKLTWDQTDPKRTKALREAFKPDADLDELNNYLAPCSSNDESDQHIKEVIFEANDTNAAASDGIQVMWEPSIEQEGNLSNNTKRGENEKTNLEKRKAKRKERKKFIAELRKQKNIEKEVAHERLRESTKDRTQTNLKEVPEIIVDERFAALYTNSAFVIDQTHSSFKNSKLLNKQVSEKRRRIQESSPNNDTETLAAALKRKSEKLVKRKS